jgi:hypothetical protein
MFDYGCSSSSPVLLLVQSVLFFAFSSFLLFDRCGYGDWFTYTNTPRALILKRNATSAQSAADMQFLMTYNDWRNDPLSQGYPENAIAARSDLGSHLIDEEIEAYVYSFVEY